MKKRRNVGKRISIFTIVLALFVTIMFAILIVYWFGNSGNKQETETKTVGKTDKEKYEEVFYDNGWDKSIVAEIKEDVPIPTGFKYISGQKETGLIIEDTKTAQKMMWIPYDENVVLDNIDEYYANVKYDTISPKAYKNMTKYGGFYVLLSEISEYGLLKDLNQDTYDSAKQKSEELYAESEVINSHLVYKTELEQIIAFANKNGINLEQTSNKTKQVTVDKLIQTNTSSLSKIANENLKLSLVVADIETDSSVGKVNGFSQKNWYIYDVPAIITTPSGKELTVPIPVGYDVEVDSNVVTITSQGKSNLSYVWIPVDEEFNTTDFSEEGIKKLNANLKQAYGIADRTQEEVLNYTEDPTDTVEYKMLQKSVAEYGGFYMGQAELGFDNETPFSNQIRGFQYITDEETGEKEAYAKNGDYYRSVTSKIVEANTKQNNANYGNSALEKNSDGSYTLTYEKAKELTEKANEGNITAAGNLVYGAQWNAAILWIINSGNGYLLEQLVQDSNSLPGAKYEKTAWERETESIKTINGLYGIAGNLSDLTQEKYSESNNTNVTIDPVTNTNMANEEYYIGRGGNYGTTGEEKTASGYQIINDETVQNDAYGIRDCLILNVGAYDRDRMKYRDETLVSSVANENRVVKTDYSWDPYFDDQTFEGRLWGNGKAILIADLIHSWLTRNQVDYDASVIKKVPGFNYNGVKKTDCSHYISMILYEYGYTSPFTMDHKKKWGSYHPEEGFCGYDAQLLAEDFRAMYNEDWNFSRFGKGYWKVFNWGMDGLFTFYWKDGDYPLAAGDIVVKNNGKHVQMYAGNNKWYNAGYDYYINDHDDDGIPRKDAPYTDLEPYSWVEGVIRLEWGHAYLSFYEMRELFLKYNSKAWYEMDYNLYYWIQEYWGENSDQAVLYVMINLAKDRGIACDSTGNSYAETPINQHLYD